MIPYFKDHSVGFGGKYGVQKDRVDQSALGYDHQEKLQKHESQKGKTLLFTPCDEILIELTIPECKNWTNQLA